MAVALVGVVQTDADSTTGWSGGGLEGELSYQGSSSYGGKVGTGTTRYTHTGTARNYSSGGGNEGDHIIVILGSLTPGKLDTKVNGGLGIICGNDGTNYGEWYVDGSDTKSPTTLFIPYIIDPASDFDGAFGSFSTTGNPAQLSAADHYGGRFDATSGIMGNFNNGLVDQITIGTGLRATGVSQTMDDFITADEGTSGNRYGFLTTREGVVYFQGKIYLGSSGSSVTFDDSDRVIVFPDVVVASDFFEIIVENASSTVTMDSFTFTAPGAAKFGMTYISASDWTISNSSVSGSSGIDMGANMTFVSTKIQASGQIVLNGGTITGGQVIDSTASSALLVDTASEMAAVTDVSFEDNTTGHSIELTATGAYTFDNITFSGGGSAGTTTADVYNNSGGAITINVLNGGSTPTVRNAAGSTTTVVSAVAVIVAVTDTAGAAIPSARVLLEAAGAGPLPAADSVSITRSGAVATVAHTAHGLSTGDQVVIRGTNQREYSGIKTITVTTANAYTFAVTGTPVTPATGTPTATAVILNGVTNASGIIQNTGFSYASDQPVSGKARKSSVSPFYRTGPIGGTITGNGFQTTIQLISDE